MGAHMEAHMGSHGGHVGHEERGGHGEHGGRPGRQWHQCNGQAAVLPGSPPELAAAPLRCPDSRSPVFESRRSSPMYDSRRGSPIFESRRNSPIFEMRAVHVLPARAPVAAPGAGAGAAECHGLDLLHRHEPAQRPHVAHVHELHELHHDCAMDLPVDMEEHLQNCRCHCDHMGYGNYQVRSDAVPDSLWLHFTRIEMS